MLMVRHLLHRPDAPVCLRELLQYREQVSVRETRGSVAGLLQLPRVHTELGRRSFRFRAATRWNEAPNDVRDAGTVSGFRTGMRKWLARDGSQR